MQKNSALHGSAENRRVNISNMLQVWVFFKSISSYMDESTQGLQHFTEVGLQRAGQGSTLCPHGQFPGSHSRSLWPLLPACHVWSGWVFEGGFVLEKIPWGHFFIKQPTNRLWWPQKCLLLELKEAWLIINPSANVPESWQWLMRHAQECVCDAEEFLVPHWLLQSALRGVAQGSEMFGKRFGGRVGKRVFQPGELMILCSPQFPPVLKSSGLCFQRESHMVRYHI